MQLYIKIIITDVYSICYILYGGYGKKRYSYGSKEKDYYSGMTTRSR